MAVTFYPNTTAVTAPALAPYEGDECLLISVGPASPNGYIEANCADCETSFVYGNIYLPDGDLSSGKGFETLQLVTANNATVAYIRIYSDAADYNTVKWEFCCYSDGSIQTDLTTPEPLVLNKWLQFQYYYDTDRDLWEVVLGDLSKDSGSLSGVTRTPRKLRCGVINSDEDTQTINFGVDHTVWDTTHWYSPIAKRYTKGAYENLPLYDSPLKVTYPHSGYTDVLTDNDIYVSHTCATTNYYVVHHFQDVSDANVDNFSVTWIGKSSKSATTASVCLQIYNQTLSTWETVSVNNTATAGFEFTLASTLATPAVTLTDYYLRDAYNASVYWLNNRVYQQCL
jgi:hypothetical protein